MIIYNALSYSIASDIRYYGHAIRHPLISYWAVLSTKMNVVKIKEYVPFHGKYFLDSGAFSAFTKGASINIDEYIEFIKEFRHIIKHYSNLDDITCPIKTLENQKYMESKGLNPVPCYHYGEDLEYLKEYCEKYKYVALGGLVPYARQKDKLKKHLNNCFSVIKKRKNKIRLFGSTSKWLLETYPVYSADSTSAFEGSRRGTISDLMKQKKLDPKTDATAFMHMDKNSVDKKYRGRVIYMCKKTSELEDYVTKLWEHRGVKW